MNEMQSVQPEHVAAAAHLTIDDGMRRWYRSCPCCLSEAYPDVKRALDDEKAVKHSTEAPAALRW